MRANERLPSDAMPRVPINADGNFSFYVRYGECYPVAQGRRRQVIDYSPLQSCRLTNLMQDIQLETIVQELRDLEARYEVRPGSSSASLSGPDRAKFKRLILEAKGLIQSAISINDFGVPLLGMANLSGYGAFDPPLPDQLHEAIALVEGGLNLVRRNTAGVHAPTQATRKDFYVDPQRIFQLQSIKVDDWDLKRLVRLLYELNIAHSNELHMATAMLVRAIADHVAPILKCKNFSEVANQYAAPRSFSEQMKQLDTSLRKVADSFLHQQIRRSEVLPLGPQVDFRAALDVLLSEIVRVLQ
jgi:hypothetical protein